MVISKNLLNQILDWDCTIPNWRFSPSHFTYTQSMVITEGFLLPFLSFYFNCTVSLRLCSLSLQRNSVFSLTWPASTQIYRNKRKRLHKKRVQLPQDWFGTQTWPPIHCFGAQIWSPWCHVKTHNYQSQIFWKDTSTPGAGTKNPSWCPP